MVHINHHVRQLVIIAMHEQLMVNTSTRIVSLCGFFMAD
jgi:hypothetical protein